jgi:hypothetical protein
MMGDEIRIGAEVVALRPTGLFEHYCEHPGCKEWGSWGYSRTKQETRCFAVSIAMTARLCWGGDGSGLAASLCSLLFFATDRSLRCGQVKRSRCYE